MKTGMPKKDMNVDPHIKYLESDSITIIIRNRFRPNLKRACLNRRVRSPTSLTFLTFKNLIRNQQFAKKKTSRSEKHLHVDILFTPTQQEIKGLHMQMILHFG
ncbi:hypothetical protein QVD17_07235 [Tagetes erecta]|uniref:Uncharacterized protein n=1 Tax=Tagetes erecta TaxID=13708 RepID=A0AAD8LQ02_TARER|nr:hypothetical protein QVD17_07235 [Tagetes erecta]